MKKYITIIFVITISAILCWSCGFNSVSTPPKKFWFTDPPERFHTNDIQKAQEQIPFVIVLPRYLPKELEPFPHLIEGPIKEAQSGIGTEINMQYQAKTVGSHMIYIREINETIISLPTASSKYVELHGIKVLEYDSSSGMHYSWNSNNIHYDTTVVAFNKEEARKIVESMIR